MNGLAAFLPLCRRHCARPSYPPRPPARPPAAQVLLECYTGRYPFAESGAAAQIALIMHVLEGELPRPPPGASPAFADFLAACIARDPATRATAAELLDSDWLAECGVFSLDDARRAVREWLQEEGLAKGAPAAAVAPAAAPAAPAPPAPATAEAADTVTKPGQQAAAERHEQQEEAKGAPPLGVNSAQRAGAIDDLRDMQAPVSVRQ